MYKVLFVDDRPKEIQNFNVIQRNNEIFEIIECTPEQHVTDTANKILDLESDLILLDYRLDETPTENDEIIQYKANPLAQHLRDLSIENIEFDVPIFVVSVEENIRAFYGPDTTSHDLFDMIFTKEYLIDNPETAKSIIEDFIKSYNTIKNNWGKDDIVNFLLEINDTEIDLIDFQFIKDISKFKAPHLISKSFYKIFIERNWLLIDNNHLKAYLGVDNTPENDENTQRLISILNDNKINYNGVLGSSFTRWWKSRLSEFLKNHTNENFENLNSCQRVEKLDEIFQLKFEPIKSRWTGKSDTYVSFLCSSCKNPTEKEYSVTAHDTVPHEIIPKKRICWKCIQTGEHEKVNLKVNDLERFIEDKLKTGEIIA